MEQFTQALWGLAAAAVTALAGVGIPLARAYLTNLVQQRLSDGAQRVAGQIAAEVAGDPNVQAATQAMVSTGVEQLRRRFPDTATKVPAEALAGMIQGHLGQMGQAVVR